MGKMIISFIVILQLFIVISEAFPDAKDETAAVDNVIGNINLNTSDSKIGAQRDIPPMFMNVQRQYGYGNSPYSPYGGYGQSGLGQGQNGLGSFLSNNGINNIDNNVNFDFQCKCTARSNLAKNMQTPTDPNQASQQQIQQLQEQIRRLQEQIQRSSSGKSSFDQFAQMLAQADGLECNCSGASSALSNFPSNGSQSRSGNIGGNTPYSGGHSGYMQRGLNGYGGMSNGFGAFSPALGMGDLSTTGFGQFYPSLYGTQGTPLLGRNGPFIKA